jgi:hypothetical protein
MICLQPQVVICFSARMWKKRTLLFIRVCVIVILLLIIQKIHQHVELIAMIMGLAQFFLFFFCAYC